jgi:hypothetical protein
MAPSVDAGQEPDAPQRFLVFVTSMVDDPRSALSRLAVAEDHADEQVAASARRRKARLTAWITSRSQQGNGPGAPLIACFDCFNPQLGA